MEALVALGLASNVIQFVDFGINATGKLQQIYKDGATIKQKDLDSAAKRLSSITASLRASLRDVQTHKALTGSETELLELADSCIGTASKLHVELEMISKQPDGGLRALLKKTARSMRRARTINELAEQLEEARRLLDTSLLISLQTMASHVIAEQQLFHESFGVAERIIISRMAAGIVSVNSLLEANGEKTRHEIIDKHDITRDHVTKEVEELRLRLSNQDERKDLLESLHFPEIKLRQEQINPAFEDTFDFIFDGSGKYTTPWSNFVEWLRSDRKLYWVQGRAGSGKSTLMQFVAEDPRTFDNAFRNSQHRLPTTTPILISYYCWSSGSELQRTLQGFLRSILYQFLLTDKTLYERIRAHTSLLEHWNPRELWSVKRLTLFLCALLEQVQGPVLIMLDGLDELEDGVKHTADVIDSVLRRQRGLKLCVSSRPLRELEKRFESDDCLKLQDLTRSSIRTYVTGVLENNSDFKRFQERYQPMAATKKSQLVADILGKAHGVFLWVKLVVIDILDGISNLDDWETLNRRLEEIPEDLEKLYQKLWKRIFSQNRSYREDATCYFRLILDREMSLLEFTVATALSAQGTSLSAIADTSLEELLEKCHERRVHIAAKCAGLLEVTSTKPISTKSGPFTCPIDAEELDQLDTAEFLTVQHQGRAVGFLHRTAADFVRSKIQDEGGFSGLDSLAQQQEASNFHVRLRSALWKLEPNLYQAVSSISIELHFYEQYVNVRYVSAITLQVARTIFDNIMLQRPPEHSEIFTKNLIPLADNFLGMLLEGGFYPECLNEILDLSSTTPAYFTYLLSCACSQAWPYKPRRHIQRVLVVLLERRAIPMGPFESPIPQSMTPSHQVLPWCAFLLKIWDNVLRDTTDTKSEIMHLGEAIPTFLRAGACQDVVIPFLCSFKKKRASDYYRLRLRKGLSKGLSLVISGTASSFLKRLDLSGLLCNNWGNNASRANTGPTDIFEVGLICYHGTWVRLNSTSDSDAVLGCIATLLKASDESKRCQSLIKVISSQQHCLTRTFDDAKAQLKEVLARSLTITDDMPYDDWRIPGWSAQLLPMLARSPLFVNGLEAVDTMETALDELGLPDQLLKLVESSEMREEAEAEEGSQCGEDPESEKAFEGGDEPEGGGKRGGGKELQGGEKSRVAEERRLKD